MWSTSHTHVVRPRWRARARAVIHSPRAALRKLVSLDVPIAANPSLWTLRDGRLGRDHLGQRRVGAAVHQPEALAHAIGDGKRATASSVADRDDLEPEHAVEAVGLGDDVLAADVGHPYRQMTTS